MKPNGSKKTKVRRVIWTATIIGLLISNALMFLLISQPWLLWPLLVALVPTVLLWIVSVVLLQRFDRYLGALAIALFVGGGAVARGIGEIEKPQAWMTILGLVLFCLQIGILVQALRQSRVADR